MLKNYNFENLTVELNGEKASIFLFGFFSTLAQQIGQISLSPFTPIDQFSVPVFGVRVSFVEGVFLHRAFWHFLKPRFDIRPTSTRLKERASFYLLNGLVFGDLVHVVGFRVARKQTARFRLGLCDGRDPGVVTVNAFGWGTVLVVRVSVGFQVGPNLSCEQCGLVKINILFFYMKYCKYREISLEAKSSWGDAKIDLILKRCSIWIRNSIFEILKYRERIFSNYLENRASSLAHLPFIKTLQGFFLTSYERF